MEKNEPEKVQNHQGAENPSTCSDLPQGSLPPRGLRWLIFGQPLRTQQYEETRLGKILALPVFCSDAISSVAYGGQQILLTLAMAGLWLPQYAAIYGQHTMTISWMIVIVLALVAVSYRQTIFAYPGGGGSYIVTKDNLGTWPGLLAAAALLIDYVLCVAVSVASGVQNLRDVPLLASLDISHHMVLYCIGAIVLMTWLNLRGLREPGVLFAVPVYVFIAMCYVMIVIGLGAEHFGWVLHPEYANQLVPPGAGIGVATSAFSIAVLLRAFATGCSALTGVEAVSNGIPAFEAPQSKNAATTLVWMATILGTIFIGISALAVKLHIVYWEGHGTSAAAVIDQISGTVFGKQGIGSAFYNLMQFSTALILLVAAQTSYADFPRVASILARDGFMPRQLRHLGDRLAFDNGIIILGILSTLFIIAKKGSVDLLIPFFTIGVFQAFTLSQSGMVWRWIKERQQGWLFRATLNGLGALATFIVFLDIVAEKFLDGAWFVVILIILLLLMFKKISAHYAAFEKGLALTGPACGIQPKDNMVIVLVQAIHVSTLSSLAYARSISNDVQAVYVDFENEPVSVFKQHWESFFPDVPLVVLPSPYRSLIDPIIKYLDELRRDMPDRVLTVIVGEYSSSKWWHSLLHGHTGFLLKLALLTRPDVVVTNVRYCLRSNDA
jgi:amino acid transporter